MKREEKYLVLFILIYSVFFALKKTGFYFPILSDHASDLICIPLSLLFIDWFLSKMTNKKMTIGFFHVMTAVLYFSLVFEVWMPSVSEKYTSDILDVFCYSLGGIIYLLFFRQNPASAHTV